MPKRLIVIGAGPLGLAAALGALERGLDVTVLEQGMVGDALRRYGSTRFFTPLEMNLPRQAWNLLDGELPPRETLMTGVGMAEEVLVPLAALPPLAGRVRTRHKVVAVGRSRLTRGELAGHPLRAERPFRVLARTPEGERCFEAEMVLDASGVYDLPAAAGAGGVPAMGEASVAGRLIRHLGALEARRDLLEGRRLLLVGHGHSAANALLLLDEVAARSKGLHVTWATRSPNRRPCVEIASDPLPERQRVASRANDLAQEPPSYLHVRRGTSIEQIEGSEASSDPLRVTFGKGDEAVFDEVVALTGYRPDLSFLSELPLEISPATEGAGRLARALTNITDCLSVPKVGPGDLLSGEPGFHLIGSKSYGRLRTFLIRTGLAQLDTILDGYTR